MYQTVITSDGLIFDLFGPEEDRQYNLTLYLQSKMDEYLWNGLIIGGRQYCLCGDLLCILSEWLQVGLAFRHQKNFGMFVRYFFGDSFFFYETALSFSHMNYGYIFVIVLVRNCSPGMHFQACLGNRVCSPNFSEDPSFFKSVEK